MGIHHPPCGNAYFGLGTKKQHLVLLARYECGTMEEYNKTEIHTQIESIQADGGERIRAYDGLCVMSRGYNLPRGVSP